MLEMWQFLIIPKGKGSILCVNGVCKRWATRLKFDEIEKLCPDIRIHPLVTTNSNGKLQVRLSSNG